MNNFINHTAPIIFGLFAALLSVWGLVPKETRRNFWRGIGELIQSSYDGRGRAGAIQFRDEETILNEIHALTYELSLRQEKDVVPVVKQMKPKHQDSDSIEEEEGVFGFVYDSTELVKVKK